MITSVEDHCLRRVESLPAAACWRLRCRGATPAACVRRGSVSVGERACQGGRAGAARISQLSRTGAWRSWLAHFLDMEKVRGSSPCAPTHVYTLHGPRRRRRSCPYSNVGLDLVSASDADLCDDRLQASPAVAVSAASRSRPRTLQLPTNVLLLLGHQARAHQEDVRSPTREPADRANARSERTSFATSADRTPSLALDPGNRRFAVGDGGDVTAIYLD